MCRWATCFAAYLMLVSSSAYGLDLTRVLAEEAAAISADFGIDVPVIVDTGDSYSTQKGAGIRIGTTRLSTDIEGIPESHKILRIRWILGHELWHQYQFGAYADVYPSTDAQTSRLFECQADMMGALYTGKTIFAGALALDNLTAYSAAIDTAANLAISLSNELVPVGGHPASDQRQMAVNFGILRAFHERVSREALSDEILSITSFARSMIEYRSDEDRTSWSYRLCQKIVHIDLAAVGALSLIDESPRMAKGASWGEYKLRYKNTSNRPIRTKLSVQIAMTFKDGIPMAPVPSQSEEFAFDLQAGAEQLIAGIMYAPAIQGFDFALIYPRRRYAHYTLISAEYLPAVDASEADFKLDESSLRPSAAALYAVLPKLAFEAKEKFSHLISGICDLSETSKSCPISVDFPGAERSRLTLSKDGDAYIYNSLYDGRSRSEARSVMRTLVEDIKAIYPTLRIPNVDFDKEDPDIEIDLTKHSAIQIYVLDPEDKDDTYTTVAKVKSTW